MEKKLDKIADDMADIKIDIAEIRKDINYHIMRTDIAESRIEMLRNELRPVEVHVERMNGALKLLGVLSLIAGLIAAVAKIIQL